MEDIERDPESPRRKFLYNTGVVVFIAVVAVLMTHLSVPLQHLHEHSLYGDMVIFGYILAWGAHAIFHFPISYYDPPIFHPERFMLPGTDGLELPALVLSPVWFLYKNPVLLMNMAVMVSHLFGLGAAYVSTRRIFRLGRPWCLILAMLFAVSSDRIWHTVGHLNLIWSGILPLIFLGVWTALERPGRWRVILPGLCLGLSVYLSVYFFVLGALTAVLTVAAWLVSRWRIPVRHAWVSLALAVLVAGVVAAPKILVYKNASARNTQTRTAISEAAAYSATLQGYLKPTDFEERYVSFWYKVLPRDEAREPGPEDGQFLGYMLMLLIAAEVGWLLVRGVRLRWNDWDRLSVFAIVAGGVLVLCSFGPRFTLAGFSPYKVLYYGYLQFSGFYRVPARLAFVVEWLWVLPVGVLFHRVQLLLPRATGAVGLVVAAPVICLEHLPAKPPAQYKWQRLKIMDLLDKQDPTGKQPYVYVSSDMGLGPALSSTHNWRPTANGWIGSPLGLEFDQRAMAFADFPSSATVAWLAQNHVPWVMLETDDAKARARSDGRLKFIGSEEGVDLFLLQNIDQLAAEVVAANDARRKELAALRSSAEPELVWPADNFIAPVGGDNIHVEDKLLRFSSDQPGVQTHWDFSRDVVPGLYDIVEVRYRALAGNSHHQARVYWEPSNQPMSEGRALAGTVSRDPEGDNQWKATFRMSADHDWLTDPDIKRLRMDFFNFDALQPVLLEVLDVKLKRLDEVPEIPAI